MTATAGFHGENPYKLIVSPDGKVYYKYYDGRGVAFAKAKVSFLGRFRYRKQIREAVEAAWVAYDKLEEDKQVGEAKKNMDKTFNAFKDSKE